MKNENREKNALFVLLQKYPPGTDIGKLSDEQKAWLQMKIRAISSGGISPVARKLRKIHNRLSHLTEDVPDKELQEMLSFVFKHRMEIEELLGKE